MSTPPQMNLLLICFELVDWGRLQAWLGRGAMPYLAGRSVEGAAGPLEAGDQGQAWHGSGDSGSIWEQLSRAGQRLGLMHLPGLKELPQGRGFAVVRAQPGSLGRRAAYPPSLVLDLADMPPAPAWASRPGLDRLPGPQRDTLFAQQAALTRISYEHTRRLFDQYKVDIGAVSWQGPALAARLFPNDVNRVDYFLAQVDRYCRRLALEFEPMAFALMALPAIGGQAGMMVRSPEMIKPGGWNQASPAQGMDLIASLGLKQKPNPESIWYS